MTQYQQIRDHFRLVDPTLFAVFEKMPERQLIQNTDADKYFSKLCQDIVSQQLGMKAADAIIARFLALFPNNFPTPELVLAQPESVYRGIGTSWAKARYIRALAEAVQNGEVKLADFPKLSDEEIVSELVKVKGIGRWTAEMFLIFTLGRTDIFSLGDLGLKKASLNIYGANALDKEILAERLKKWSPYQSYACLALWHSLDNR